ncbi:MAG TPA: sigma 54-interacting transcriptional regulator [Vicinamibacterales bacterium]|jgi:DNA-binding NtrC family response regulator
MSELVLLGAAPLSGQLSTETLELVGASAATARSERLVQRAAALDCGVLIVGEPGVDLSGVAREMHLRGRGSTAAFVIVDCGAGPGTQLERRLFGTRAALAPADLEAVSADSRVAAARGGTLFLQHVSELPAGIQARLARILRDGEIQIGGARVAFDARVVASSPPGIDDDVHEHRFRPELYRRLAAARIDLPPLRDRADDVGCLAERILAEVCAAKNAAARRFTQPALALLAALNWPGNLAELRAVVARVAAACGEPVIPIERIVPALQLKNAPAPFAPLGKLRDARLRFERDYIAAVLQHHGWRMNDAAQTLGIQRPNLYRKARQLGIPITRITD